MIDAVDPVLEERLPVSARRGSPSRIRDHLANERTYLAWMRTSIALMGFGVVIARLRYLLGADTPGTGRSWLLGVMFALVGLASVILSTQHYFAVLRSIEMESYEPTSRWVNIFSLILVLMGFGVLYVLFSVPVDLRLALFQSRG